MRCEVAKLLSANGARSRDTSASQLLPPSDDDDGRACPLAVKFSSTEDLKGALARVRADFDVGVEVGADGSVDRVVMRGQIDDLYDFSFAAPGIATVAAAVQLGFRPDARPAGQIYRDTFEIEYEWSGLPRSDDCP